MIKPFIVAKHSCLLLKMNAVRLLKSPGFSANLQTHLFCG